MFSTRVKFEYDSKITHIASHDYRILPIYRVDMGLDIILFTSDLLFSCFAMLFLSKIIPYGTPCTRHIVVIRIIYIKTVSLLVLVSFKLLSHQVRLGLVLESSFRLTQANLDPLSYPFQAIERVNLLHSKENVFVCRFALYALFVTISLSIIWSLIKSPTTIF